MRFGVYSFCHAVISSRFFSFDIFPTWKCQFYVFIIWDEDFLSEAEKPAWPEVSDTWKLNHFQNEYYDALMPYNDDFVEIDPHFATPIVL